MDLIVSNLDSCECFVLVKQDGQQYSIQYKRVNATNSQKETQKIGLSEWERWSTRNTQILLYLKANDNHKVIWDIDSQTDYPIQKGSNYQGENNESGFRRSNRQELNYKK